MKKIYINNTKRAVFFGGTMLLPGSNAVEEIDKKKFPALAQMIEEDEIEESEDPASAVKKANTQAAVDAIAKMGKGEGDGKLQENAKKRTQQLNKLKEDAEAAAAAKKSEDEKEDNSEEGV